MRIGCSADGYKLVFGYVVPDRMDERDGSAIIYGSSIDAATLELIKECLVVIGTHTSPAAIADLMIEYCSCLSKRQSRVLIRESACLQNAEQT